MSTAFGVGFFCGFILGVVLFSKPNFWKPNALQLKIKPLKL